MMVLSGAMFSFDKLNRKIGNVEKVPVIAELMPTRWTYEALMVSQFKDNRYSRQEYTRLGETFYTLQKKISEADFNKVYRIPELRKALGTSLSEYRINLMNPASPDAFKIKYDSPEYSRLELLRNELIKMPTMYRVPAFRFIDRLTPEEFNPDIADSVLAYLGKLDDILSGISNSASDRKDRFYNLNSIRLNQLQNQYYNFKVEEIVTKYYERNKILLYKNTIIQNTDPVYLDPYKRGPFGFRTHFYAPAKYIFGIMSDTFVFNVCLVLLSTIILYITLYYELLAKVVNFVEKFRFRKRLLRNLK